MRRSRTVAVSLAVALASSLGYRWWYSHRGPPDPIAEHALFRGMTYERLVRTSPRPMAIHLARVELAHATPFVTPSDRSGGRDVVREARSTCSLRCAIRSSPSLAPRSRSIAAARAS